MRPPVDPQSPSAAARATASPGPVHTPAFQSSGSQLALQAMSALASQAVADPLRGSDRGEALAQGWAEYGQTGRADVGGDLRTLAAQYGQVVAGRLSSTSPVNNGRIDRALDEFARALQAGGARPHRTAGGVVEPLLRTMEADLQRRSSPQGDPQGDVEGFVATVQTATAILRRLPPA